MDLIPGILLTGWSKIPKIMERERWEIGNSIYSEYIVDWLVLEFPEIMERGGLEISNSKYSRYIVDRLGLEILEIMERGGIRNRELNIFQV